MNMFWILFAIIKNRNLLNIYYNIVFFNVLILITNIYIIIIKIVIFLHNSVMLFYIH